MQLSVADDNDAIQISRQIYDLWSAGLRKENYRELFWNTYQQPWSKRNVSRVVYKIAKEVVFSCKTTRLSLFRKNNYYRIMGLGAVFTAPSWRKQGLAKNLIKAVINQAKEDNLDGLLLFSAIDKDFYSSLGFRNLGSLDFEICPQNYSSQSISVGDFDQGISIEWRNARILLETEKRETISKQLYAASFEPWFSENELAEILRCYKRWVVKQPYGIARDRHYYSFQLAKFLYVANHSTVNQNQWFLTIAKDERTKIIGYAITECSGTTMRIIELIGDNAARSCLWQTLIIQAQKMSLIAINGFESLVNDFIPHCHLDLSFFSLKPIVRPSHIQCYERLWSQPMFLSCNAGLADLQDISPCPLLEFDYP